MSNFRRIICFLLFICFVQDSIAQFKFKKVNPPQHSNSRISSDVRDSTKIFLPFWDDFSRTSYLPDSTHWFIDPGSTLISSSVGINAPTLNVAVFDGWNNQGIPYSSMELEEGAGDSLVSRYIDMSGINPALYQTTYISFYWQKEGRGEQPDARDSIRLQVISEEKEWITVWSKTGSQVSETDRFFSEIIPVQDPSFFHEFSQFRFQTFGRLSGGFDTWNIDYVYFNFNRNPNDLVFEDRAMVDLPSSWLTQFTAMPYRQFLANLTDNLQPTVSSANNLNDQVQAIEFSALIQDSIRIYDQMNDGTPINLVPETNTELRSEPIDPNAFDDENDSLRLTLETKFFLTSGDSANWLNKYDLRVNDTTTSVVRLVDELAYDDGTAEWAAGLSQRAATLAYRFVVPKTDVITSVKFYFPEFSPPTSGQTFTLIIWDDIFQYREGRLLTEQHVVQRSTQINQFTEYHLGRPVAVQDTFYVGYEQSVPDFFAVGLDKSGVPQEGNIFINLDGVWEASNIVDGNLMIRPVFDFQQAVGLEDEFFEEIEIYPNPNHGVFNVRGDFEEVEIIDLTGNSLVRLANGTGLTEIRLGDRPQGLYLLKVSKNGKYRTYKFVIQ